MGLAAVLLLAGTAADCARVNVDIEGESAFHAGKKLVYAVETHVRIDQEKGKVKRIVLDLVLYRAEVFHLVKAGVIKGVKPGDLLAYKPLKPIEVKLKAGPKAVRSLNMAWRGKGDLGRLFGKKGPWRQLKNYDFVSLEQRTGKAGGRRKK